nr:MAG TPA: hypothetical protein [Caudoviricetes sp.]
MSSSSIVSNSPLRLIAYGYPVNEPSFGVIIKFKIG